MPKKTRIGMYDIIEYPNVVWAQHLPYSDDLRKFKTYKAAETYVYKKIRKDNPTFPK